MPWGYGSSYTAVSHLAPSKSAWQRRGETMSLNNALDTHSLTEEDVRTSDPPIERQWRSTYGNSYAVVKCSDIVALKKRVEHAKMVAKYGEDGWKQKQQEDEEHKSKEAQEKRDQQQRDQTKTELRIKWIKILEVSNGDIADSIEGLQLAKTNAKKEWFLRDQDLTKLQAEQVGRSMKYKVTDLIRQSEIRAARFRPVFGEVHEKLRGHRERLRQYGRYLKDQLDKELEEHPRDLIEEAIVDAKSALEVKVRQSETMIKQTEAELKQNQKRMTAFERCLPPSSATVPCSDKENAPRSKKKQRVVS